MKKKLKAYKTFNTICQKCRKSVKVVKFPVSIGRLAFALCPEHLEDFIELAEEMYPELKD